MKLNRFSKISILEPGIQLISNRGRHDLPTPVAKESRAVEVGRLARLRPGRVRHSDKINRYECAEVVLCISLADAAAGRPPPLPPPDFTRFVSVAVLSVLDHPPAWDEPCPRKGDSVARPSAVP